MSFRREKFVPRGGPNGGDGGHGGSVVPRRPRQSQHAPQFPLPDGCSKPTAAATAKASNRTGKKRRRHHAPRSRSARRSSRSRKTASTRSIADLTSEGEEILIAKGGLGGQGNARFATSTNRAPRKAQPGLPGEEKDLRLQLKLLADVGPRRLSQRRQVDDHLAHLGRQAEDRRLSVHHVDAEPRRRRAVRRPHRSSSPTCRG